jgi:hypothetical protein
LAGQPPLGNGHAIVAELARLGRERGTGAELANVWPATHGFANAVAFGRMQLRLDG